MTDVESGWREAPRVLLVEDDELHRYLLKECLATRGRAIVDVAVDVHTAVERLRAAVFDAVVVGYTLPDACSLDVLRMIREQGWDVPVIMVTDGRSAEVAAALMKAGAADYVIKDSATFERLPRTIAEVIAAHRRRQLQHHRLAELEHLASEDFLTSLANRRTFEQRFRQEWERARRYGRPLALAILDLDDFKVVNDTWGHRVGDRALVMVARTLRESFRLADVVARYGGDEFVVLMPETDEVGARAAIVRFRSQLDQLNGKGSLPVALGVSVGLAIHADEPGPEALLEAADRALYAVKQPRRQGPSPT